jgi:hypothetical protein
MGNKEEMAGWFFFNLPKETVALLLVSGIITIYWAAILRSSHTELLSVFYNAANLEHVM